LKRFRNTPYHLIFFASYPILVLFAFNISEIRQTDIWRPLILANILAILGFTIGFLVWRNSQKSALIISILLIAFFSFGHLHSWLRSIPQIGLIVGRFRYLVIFYSVLLLFLCAWIIIKAKDIGPITGIMNFIGLLLIVLPLISISTYYLRQSEIRNLDKHSEKQVVNGLKSNQHPDVYFVVLDAYDRQDVLLSEFGYDNSNFIDGLKKLGFYVANCSRSNYQGTLNSFSSALNMEYIQTLGKDRPNPTIGFRDTLIQKIKQSKVIEIFKGMGYQLVAFDTGVPWTSMVNADVYVENIPDPLFEKTLRPFESLILQKSAAIIMAGGQPEVFNEIIPQEYSEFSYHTNRIKNILKNLPKTSNHSGPKIVFVHLVIPHPPYVFAPDGTMIQDTRYFSGEYGKGITDEYSRKGYISQVEFVNNQMLPILSDIIQNSMNPPIIILEGDHGYKADEFSNLEAYFVPSLAKDKLYPTITPVNSFRLIFNNIFGMDYPLLPDISYYAMCKDECDYRVVEESSPYCR
jgi:hypothetical protein